MKLRYAYLYCFGVLFCIVVHQINLEFYLRLLFVADLYLY